LSEHLREEVVTRVARDERGAALILAIVFMLVLGTISAAGFSLIASGLHSRVGLDVVRNRQYAADAGVEAAITDARPDVTTWANASYDAAPLDAVQTFLNSAQCGGPRPKFLNNVSVQVSCLPAPALHAGYFAFNVIFTACMSGDAQSGVCPAAKAIVRAQVNFDFDVANRTVKSTYVQSWSVNT
jgi:Tfp pilus assembly protein PilX